MLSLCGDYLEFVIGLTLFSIKAFSLLLKYALSLSLTFKNSMDMYAIEDHIHVQYNPFVL